jgi:ribosomal peptide maturation radical SAM protein 1
MTDVVFFVPPWALPQQPSLAAHLLQACAARAGFAVQVVYANADLARFLGEADYRLAAQGSYSLVGERLFARAAWGLPPLGRWADRTFDWEAIFGTPDYGTRDRPFVGWPPVAVPTVDQLRVIEEKVSAWVEDFADRWAGQGAGVFACTSSYEQNNAAFALLGAIKRRRPDAFTLLGGANAEGSLARGLASLDPETRIADVIFQGETEAEFVAVLEGWRRGRRPSGRIVVGRPTTDLDALPLPDFADYFDQNPGASLELPYETSRGCWWGARSACLFCGYVPEKLAFRTKDPDRVLADWRAWAERYPGLRIQTTDLVQPPEYFDTLLPRLAEARLPLSLYWEERADLTWDQLKVLRAANVLEIQPGIENFSSRLLGTIRKGAKPAKSLNTLRWAASLGIRVYWNLLWGIPGETLADYGPVLALLEAIPHLPAPFGLSQVLVLRDSEYHRHPQKWGLDRVEPVRTFGAVYPDGADLGTLASVFHPTYQAETLTDRSFLDRLERLFLEWNRAANSTDERRLFLVAPQGPDRYLVLDTRRLADSVPFELVGRDQARALLASGPYEGTALQDQALARRQAVVLDGEYVPLATAAPEVWEALVFGTTVPPPGAAPPGPASSS